MSSTAQFWWVHAIPAPTSLALPETRPVSPVRFDRMSPPAVTGTIIHVNAGASVQDAIDLANFGDAIQMEAGATFEGRFTLPAKSGSGWVTIRTSAYLSLPTEGERVDTGAHGALMSKIRSSASLEEAIRCADGAHGYYFLGIEFESPNTVTTATQGNVVLIRAQDRFTPSAIPQRMVFDRCWVHGQATGNCRVGIELSGDYCQVLDSAIDDCHDTGSDSQAIHTNDCYGPMRIENNRLEGAGENFMSGGDTVRIPGMIPSDIHFEKNHCFKPLSWNPSDPSYGGINWSVKNLFEIKNGRRVNISQCRFENNWVSAQDGGAILFTPRNQFGANPETRISDVEYSWNHLVNSPHGFTVKSGDDAQQTDYATQRMYFHNNLTEKIGNNTWRIVGIKKPDNTALTGTYVTCDHNTDMHPTGGNLWHQLADSNNFPFQVFRHTKFSNTLASGGSFGIHGSNSPVGTGTIDNYLVHSWDYSEYVVLAGSNLQQNWFSGTGIIVEQSLDDIGFVDWLNSNWELSAGSPYKGAASDGSDIGISDYPAFLAAQAGVITGVWP